MSPTVVIVDDLILAATGTLRQPEVRALLITIFRAQSNVGTRVYRFFNSTGRRDRTCLSTAELVDDDQYDGRFTVEFLADSRWRLRRPKPTAFDEKCHI